MKKLRSYIANYGFLTVDEYEEVFRHVSTRVYKKGEFFLKAGMVAHKVGYVSEGLLRYFEDENNTRYFAREDDFITDLDSFNNQIPSVNFIQAITDCTIVYFTKESLAEAIKQAPSFELIVQRITESWMLKNVNHKSPLLLQDTAIRYEHFLREYPDIHARSPLEYITSYLGISDPQLLKGTTE